MAVNPREIELFRTQLEPVDQQNPGLMRWLHHNFAAMQLLKEDLEAAIAAAPVDEDITGLQDQIDVINTTLISLQNQINNIELIPGPQGATGAQGIPGVSGPPGPAGPAGGCGSVLAVPNGWQITIELCGTLFIGA